MSGNNLNRPDAGALQPEVDLNTAHRQIVTGNPHVVTKTEVGLGNVDNTSDANKPVSTAQQTALDLKVDDTEKGAANGVATLDSGSLIPTAQLPANTLLWSKSTGIITTLTSTDIVRFVDNQSVTFGTGDDVTFTYTPTGDLFTINKTSGQLLIGDVSSSIGFALDFPNNRVVISNPPNAVYVDTDVTIFNVAPADVDFKIFGTGGSLPFVYDAGAKEIQIQEPMVMNDSVSIPYLRLVRVNTTRRNTLTPVTAMILYNTDTNTVQYWNGSSWV